MKRLIFCILLFLLWTAVPVLALQGHRGDIMVAKAPINSSVHDIMIMQNKLRMMNEELLIMQVPQYQFGDYIVDQQLLDGSFIYHTEILHMDYNFEDITGYTWHRHRFTDFGKSLLDPNYAGDIYQWIVNRVDQYKMPIDETNENYRKYCNRKIQLGDIPLMMIGTEYGQTVEDYTNFADFYGVFMKKHHYCITATNWALYKAIYDKCPWMRLIYEESFSDPQVVQSFDTLTGGRLVGFLLSVGFIEEY